MMQENASTPRWPARAVVTAGMPYGNKPLHFGHVGGVFVPADCFARFLSDRIGADNVRFVSGTDCYGSPIQEGYRSLVEAGKFTGTIEDYVQANHDAQAATLRSYDVGLSVFEGSGIGNSGAVHTRLSADFVRALERSGHLHRRRTLQFFDEEAGVFLNGRQVVGRCPVPGCKSERGYADECSLGHSYEPVDLIAPRSTLTDSTPVMRPVDNWYFDLPAFHDDLARLADGELSADDVRPVVVNTVREFLNPPIMFIKVELRDAFDAIAADLPAHTLREAAEGKQSFEVEFASIDDRDAARTVLTDAGVRFRCGKTLVPFRISGNTEWGVAFPDTDGPEPSTIWVWPESLWAPISFTAAVGQQRGDAADDWRRWWCSPDARVYQFVGQDNIYFYGVAQPALWSSAEAGSHDAAADFDFSGLRQTTLVANYHMLLDGKKASSSGDVKPPSADELLEYYSAEQLRAHWLALGLDRKSVSFNPKAFSTDPSVRDNPRASDPVLKEGALLTKVFNRLARSCLYEAKNHFDTMMPLGPVTPELVDEARATMADYEAIMHRVELHSIMSLMDDYIRRCNRFWSDGSRALGDDADPAARRQLLVDSFYLLRICTLLMHPVVPRGTEKIVSYLNIDPQTFFDWDAPFSDNGELCDEAERAAGMHPVRELPPRTDFFDLPAAQIKN